MKREAVDALFVSLGESQKEITKHIRKTRNLIYLIARNGLFKETTVCMRENGQIEERRVLRVGTFDGERFFWGEERSRFYWNEKGHRVQGSSKRYFYEVLEVTPVHKSWPRLAKALLRSWRPNGS